MLSPKTIQRALKNETEPHIYSRGVSYFQGGRVLQWQAGDDQEDDTINITGKVRGSDMYTVIMEFDTRDETFVDLVCTCPYGDVCKHIVAVGLTFAESLRNGRRNSDIIDVQAMDVQKNTDMQTDDMRLRTALEELGISSDSVPESLIGRLLQYRKPTFSAVPVIARQQQKSGKPAKPKPFNPQNYRILLDAYHGYAPSLYEKNDAYQQADSNKVLQQNGVTPTQRELLAYINDGKFSRDASPPPDTARLFPLLTQAGFPVFIGFSFYGSSPVTIELHPQALKADIVYEPTPMYADETVIRHDFFLRMQEEYWKGKNVWYDQAFFINGASLVRDHGNVLELHQLTAPLAGIIARLKPVFDYEQHAQNVQYHQAILTGKEVEHFDQLVQDATRLFACTAPPPQLVPQPVPAAPQPALAVDFDNAAQSLCVMPVMNYGVYLQDVSESVYVSRRADGGTLRRRPPFAHPGSHIVTVEGGVIRHTKVRQKQEIQFYRELAGKAQDFGFSKTLKCFKRGSRQLAEYLHTAWPKLAAYAEQQGYPIVFTKDELAREQAAFRADFTADLHAENDWLYFDLTCYCADERVTLEKLLAFIENGEPFWRKDDGTLVEISNRQELERLARLLKSFHARENGGFEGKLYHAPELAYVMTSSPYYTSVRAKSFQQFFRRVQKGKPVKTVRLPNALARVVRPYQKHGIAWLYFLRSYRFAGILADDMGLGKTLQTLSVLSMERVVRRPSIVVCPKTLLYNWKLEAEKFFPDLRVLIYDGTPQERGVLRKGMTRHDLLVVSYSTLKQDGDIFSKSTLRFNYAVLDEAQFIKNHATKNAQAVKKLNADFRLALTGTPLENSVSELWSIYDFLMPGFLGSYEHFAKHFHRPIMDAGDRQALEHLRRKVESFMLRRTKAEVLQELPPKIEQVSQCHLSEAQNVLYQQILAKVSGDVFAAVKDKGFQSAQIHILAGLTKLRQACNHPALLTKDKNFRAYESAKLDMCMELVDEVLESGRKVLIFSQFTQMLDIVSAALNDRNIPHAYLSGKTKNRQDVIHTFSNDPKIPVFLISLKAGGTGLNLTAADTVIIFDPWWNPSVENQAIDRTHRIGQTKTVNVYRLLTLGTIEEKIQALKQKKQRLFDAMVGESGDLFQKLTWDDVRELFAPAPEHNGRHSEIPRVVSHKSMEE